MCIGRDRLGTITRRSVCIDKIGYLAARLVAKRAQLIATPRARAQNANSQGGLERTCLAQELHRSIWCLVRFHSGVWALSQSGR